MTVAHGQWSLRSLTQGDGTAYDRTGPIGGLGVAPPRRIRVRRGSIDGDAAGYDTLPARMLTFPMTVKSVTGCSPAQAEEEVNVRSRALRVAWNRLSLFSITDLELELGMNGFPSADETLRFYGRPDGLDLDYSMARIGALPAFASFLALDPYGYGASVTVTGSSSPASISTAGETVTNRFTITVVGNGGTPTLVSVTDDNNSIAFNTTLSGNAILDFREQTVTIGGVSSYTVLQPAPEWFFLHPGSNTLTFTGCAAIIVSHQPAYL